MEESRPLNSVLLSHIKTPTSGLAAFGMLSLGAESTDAASKDTENENVELHGPFFKWCEVSFIFLCLFDLQYSSS